MRLRDRLRQWRYSESLPKRLTHTILLYLWRSVQVLAFPGVRSQLLTRMRFGDRYLQQSVFTHSNRYPVLFRTIRDQLASHANPKIMSFGCATGEEVRTLGEYLPDATVVGVDINSWCLRQARLRSSCTRHRFVHRYSSQFEEEVDFDAIVCLAVFQHTQNRTNPNNELATGISFGRFEEELRCLDGKIRTRGLLVIDLTDFDFQQTACSQHYSVLNCDQNRVVARRPLYDRHGRKISDEQHLPRLFVKCS